MIEHLSTFNNFEKYKRKTVEIFGINAIHQKQIAAIFVIFTKMKMLDRQYRDITFFALLLQLILFGWNQ